MPTTPESFNSIEAGLKLLIPSKTFVLGEYIALKGGPALVAATEPYFEIQMDLGEGKAFDIHGDSPAGLFWNHIVNSEGELRSKEGTQDYSDSVHPIFNNLDIRFIDPHQGAGGLGASSAQFVGVYSICFQFQFSKRVEAGKLDWRHLLETYRNYAWDGVGLPPSGYDVVAQINGGLTYFSENENVLHRDSWPFKDLEMIFIRTGKKVPTHHHLKEDIDIPEDELTNLVHEARRSLLELNEELFLDSIKSYCDCLDRHQLLAAGSRSLIDQLYETGFVRAAKGCGALGADIILAVVSSSDKDKAFKWLEQNGLSVVATSNHIGSGLSYK